MRRVVVAPFLVLAVVGLAVGQTGSPAAQQAAGSAAASPPMGGSLEKHPKWPQASGDDVKTVDGTIAALYAVISGAAGEKRDWNKFRSLFLPDGRLVVTRAAGVGGATHGDAVVLSIDDYVQRVSDRFESGVSTNMALPRARKSMA